MSTSTSPAPQILGHDLLRDLGLGVEGPAQWGRPVYSKSPGVFLVELPAPMRKVSIDPNAIRDWLNRAPDLRLDGKRPTVPELQSRLASFWLPNQTILYIGSSLKSVGARIAGMYKTPLGERRPQSAGYWLKTLHDVGRTRIWWVETPEAEEYEDSLIETFRAKVGALPYAVLASPSGERRTHGLSDPLHDEAPAPQPVRPTRVTVLPDADEEQMEAGATPVHRRGAAAARPAIKKPAAPRKKPMPLTGPSAIETVAPRRKPGAAKAAAAAAATPAIAPTHLTREGLDALQSELDELTTHHRPEVIARIKAARELGDLSENADYEAARKEQSFLEGRVLQLEQMIKYAVIIESGSEGGAVTMGSTVTVETDRHGEETFTIVGSAEADAASGKISFTSPIGRALMGHRAGETVRVHVPAGAMDFKISEVR